VPVINDEDVSMATVRVERCFREVWITMREVSMDVRKDLQIGGRPEAQRRSDRGSRERGHDQKRGVEPRRRA
jgi:hypothetical protein